MLPQKVETLIIGGGVVGCSIAYWLAKSGRKPVLLEKDEIASAASGSNLGQISITDRETGCQLDWSLRSLDLYREFDENGEFSTGLEETGGLFILKSREEAAKTMHLVTSHKAAGIDIEMLYGEEVQRHEPLIHPSTAAAIWCAREGRVDPLSITYGLRDAAVQMGARVYTGTAVTGFETDAGRIVAVNTNRGRVETGTVVMATAAWTAELCRGLGLLYPIGYDRANVFVCQPVPPCIRGPIVTGAFLTGEFVAGNWTNIGAMQHKNGSIILGQSTRSTEDYNTGIAYEEPVHIARIFREYFPALSHLQVIRMWSGVTPAMPDEMPLFGWSGVYGNLFMAAGLKGAFTTAPAAGESAAQIITGGKSDIDCGEYSPKRFEKEAACAH